MKAENEGKKQSHDVWHEGESKKNQSRRFDGNLKAETVKKVHGGLEPSKFGAMRVMQ